MLNKMAISAVMLSTSFLAGCGSPSDCKVALLGDSVTHNIADHLETLASEEEGFSYKFDFNNLSLKGAGLIHRPTSRSGKMVDRRTIEDFVSRVDTGDYVVISAGANDVLSRHAASKIEDGSYKGRFSSLVSQVLGEGGQPILLLYDFSSKNSYFSEDQTMTINTKVNEFIKQVAEEQGLPVVSTSGLERYDGVHLKRSGSSELIGRIWKQTSMSSDPACSLTP